MPEPSPVSPAVFPVPIAFADVDIRDQLQRRPTRAHRIDAEHRAFTLLAAEMAANPHNMLQKLVEVAVELTGAHTAGISLLDGDVCRWEAVAGVLASARGGTMPRQQSPCGVCIDNNSTQLMHLADRCFPALAAQPRFVEALLIPFHRQGVPIGTVWLVSHTDERKFDRGDERLLSQLSQFASAGWQMLEQTERLATLNRRKDDFLALLGHEMRTPIGAIVTATALVNKRLAGDVLGSHATGMISRQTRHLLRLADDLLDIARIESGKLELDCRQVDVRGIVGDAIEGLRGQIDRRHHTLIVELGEEPLLVNADGMRLTQVVSNLLQNATKYTPEHGRISIRITHELDRVVVRVSDSGVGIPDDQTQQIFEPFLQLERSQHVSGGGLGLGLALVKKLTELLGGTVTVESGGAGAGSCFTIRLPLAATD